MKKTALIFLLPFFIMASCKKYRCPATVYCSTGFNFVLVGFDTSELDTVIMRVYKADNTFSSVVDTALIADTIVQNSFNGPQYVWLPLFGNYRDSMLNGSLLLTQYRGFDVDTAYIGYDWEVYIPKAQRTYRITGMKYGGGIKQTVETCDQKGNNIGGSCNQYLASFAINGQVQNYSGHDFMNWYNFIFLKK